MNDLTFWSAFLVGLAGGVHCIGMCGGVVIAFNAATPDSKSKWPYTLAYNSGRILSYVGAGAITGALGHIVTRHLPYSGPILAIISAFMLIAMACYLGQWWNGLVHVERLGKQLWRRIQPFSRQFIPFKSPLHALPYGMIWGWLPCGLVYSTLTWSMASGSLLAGATIMAGFGLGTLPTLIATALGADWLTRSFRLPVVRQCLALMLFLYACLLMWRAISTIH